MTRYLLIPTLLIGTMATASSAEARCQRGHQNPFDQLERAAHVAVAVVGERTLPAPVNKSGYRKGTVTVTLDVQRTLKGPPAVQLVARDPMTTLAKDSCAEAFPVGKTGVVMLGRTGRSIAFVPDAARWQATLAAWAKARSPSARAAVLVDALTGGDLEVAGDAARFLLDSSPKLLRQIDATRRAALESFTRTGGDNAAPARQVLARMPRR